jgi:hypothetical protein
MLDWIIPAVLYLLVLVGFRWLGGLQAAGTALRRWGRATSTIADDRPSPSG